MTFKRMSELALDGKRVLIREDLNVPIKAGVITSDARIRAALPTLKAALDEGAQVIVMSHLGRPQEGVFDAALSLQPIAVRLSELLGEDVPLMATVEAAESLSSRVALLENVRFLEGEKANGDDLAKRLAALGEVFVMDAFATAHRAQASTVGVARYAATACAGPLLAAELAALARALENPKRPLVVIVGGAKVSTKLAALQTLGDIADRIIVGGGIANTFIAAKHHNVGASLFQADLVDSAKAIAEHVEVPIPVDVMVGKRLIETETAVLKPIDALADDDMILDIGAETARQWKTLLDDAGTILWNGPVGVFEIDQFGEGTRVLAEAIAASSAFSIAGGGDTLAAIDKYGVRDGVSYISTGGGAFLEFVEGKELPAVAMLQSRANG